MSDFTVVRRLARKAAVAPVRRAPNPTRRPETRPTLHLRSLVQAGPSAASEA